MQVRLKFNEYAITTLYKELRNELYKLKVTATKQILNFNKLDGFTALLKSVM